MKAVVVIDMLNDFVTGDLACERAQRIIPNLQKLLAAARAAGQLVIFSNDAHLPEGDKEFEVWGPHAIVGTEGARVIPELPPQPEDYVVPKRRYSGFMGTDLDILLREHQVDEVILTGLHTNICVRHTCADAFYNGYRLTVPDDAVDAFTEKDHSEGLDYLKRVYGARVIPTEEVIRQFVKVT
jgi:nicotinamidase-related amidase